MAYFDFYATSTDLRRRNPRDEGGSPRPICRLEKAARAAGWFKIEALEQQCST